MKVNFDTPLKGLNGEDLKNETGALLTLKGVCVSALTLSIQGDPASGDVKFKRYELALKINGGGEVEILPEEASTLKERVGAVYGPLVVGPAYVLLNG